MKSPLELLNEVHEAGKSHPAIYSSPVADNVLIAAMLELESRIRQIQETKQDKASHESQSVPSNELTRGSIQVKIHRVLTAAGDKEQEVALKIYRFLATLG